MDDYDWTPLAYAPEWCPSCSTEHLQLCACCMHKCSNCGYSPEVPPPQFADN